MSSIHLLPFHHITPKAITIITVIIFTRLSFFTLHCFYFPFDRYPFYFFQLYVFPFLYSPLYSSFTVSSFPAFVKYSPIRPLLFFVILPLSTLSPFLIYLFSFTPDRTLSSSSDPSLSILSRYLTHTFFPSDFFLLLFYSI